MRARCCSGCLPTTLTGVAELLEHVAREDGTGKTILATAFEADEFKMAAATFPRALAATVRGLIGELRG
jgi:hypothetical protein